MSEERNRPKRWASLKVFWQKLTAPFREGFLCDTCRYDYGAACRRRERPNARVCPDHKKR